jgi:hypothetical protein
MSAVRHAKPILSIQFLGVTARLTCHGSARLAHRQDWQAVLFDTYGLATDRGLPARLLKLRDMPYNDYNADTL